MYLLNSIDDYSKMLRVYFIERKTKAFYVFKKFKVLAGNQIGKIICVLNTNRRGKLCNYAFESLGEKCGIKI